MKFECYLPIFFKKMKEKSSVTRVIIYVILFIIIIVYFDLCFYCLSKFKDIPGDVSQFRYMRLSLKSYASSCFFPFFILTVDICSRSSCCYKKKKEVSIRKMEIIKRHLVQPAVEHHQEISQIQKQLYQQSHSDR